MNTFPSSGYLKTKILTIACLLTASLLLSVTAQTQQAPVYTPNDPAKDPSIMKVAGRLYAYQKSHSPVVPEIVLAECDWPVLPDPDYAGKLYPPLNKIASEPYEVDSQNDPNHGGKSLSAALAVTDNGEGVISVGGLMDNLKGQPIKVRSANGTGSSSALQLCIEGVLELRAQGINIRGIHLGWSTTQPDSSGETDRLITKLATEGQGVLIFVGVGEEGKNLDTNPTYPAGYARDHWNVVLVQATRKDGTVFPTTSTSSFVRYKAPGENIQVISYFPGFNAVSFSGSTPASAIVAASILEIMSYRQPDAWLSLQLADGNIIDGNIDSFAALTQPPIIATSPLEVGTDRTGPFKIDGDFAFSADKTDKVCRIALNVQYLDFLAGEDLSAVTVEAVDSAGQHVFLPVEAIGELGNSDRRYKQVQVRLAVKPTAAIPNPPQLATGAVSLTVTHRGLSSPAIPIQVVR